MTQEKMMLELEEVNIDEPRGGMIEDVVQGWRLPSRLVRAIERFLWSRLQNNRFTALWALVYFNDCIDRELEAICLHVSGLTNNDDPTYRGAISILSCMEQRENAGAGFILDYLRIDEQWCIDNDMIPINAEERQRLETQVASLQMTGHVGCRRTSIDSFESALLVQLESVDINQPCRTAIEDIARFALVSKRAMLAIGKFACSTLLENRFASVWARVQLGQSDGIELEAICLHALGINHGDPKVRVGTIGLLSQLADRGNNRAQKILDILHLDANWFVANLDSRH